MENNKPIPGEPVQDKIDRARRMGIPREEVELMTKGKYSAEIALTYDYADDIKLEVTDSPTEQPAVAPSEIVAGPEEVTVDDDENTAAPEISLEEFAARKDAEIAKRRQQKVEATATLEAQEEVKSWYQPVLDAFKADNDDTGDGFIDNSVEVGLTALETAAEGIARTIGDVGGEESSSIVWGNDEVMSDKGIGIPFTNMRIGLMGGKEFADTKALYEIRTGKRAATLSDFDLPDADRPDSPAGRMAADMLKWVTVFAATRTPMGGGTAVAQVGKGMAAGALTDFSVFDPHEDRLSDMIQDWGKGNVVFDNAVTDYLAADATDSNLEGRMKNAIEGLALGALSDSIFASLRWYRIRLKNKKLASKEPAKAIPLRATESVSDVVEEVADDAVKAADDVVPGVDVEANANNKFLDEKKKADAVDGTKKTNEDIPVSDQTLPPRERARTSVTLKSMTTENIEKFARSLKEGNYADLDEMVNFNEGRIDWDNIDDGEGLLELFRGMEDAAADILGEGAGGPVSHEAVAEMAEQVGYSAQRAGDLFGDLKAEHGITARMFAAHQTMIASGRHLQKLAKLAESGDPDAVFRFHRHIEAHAATMGQVKGSQAEIARALGSMRMMKGAMTDSFSEFEEIIAKHGGTKATKDLASKVLESNDLKHINDAVAKITEHGFMDVLSEIVINGLLSSVKTHVINITSNAGMLVLGPAERYLGWGVGKFRVLSTKEKSTLREANAAMVGHIASITTAARYAARAFADELPVSDIRQRVEFANRKAIRMDPKKYTGSKVAVAHTVNAVGTVIRIPGRFLLAADEFFKTINKQGEMAAMAVRVAQREAGKRSFKTNADRIKFIKMETRRRMTDPTPEMEAEAVHYSRRQTFQENNETSFGGSVGALMSSHPMIKLVVAPFVKTPMNILRQAFVDRNPILAPFVKANRDALAKGGPKADLIVARTVMGTGLMIGAYSMVSDGIITGNGRGWQNSETLDKIPASSIKLRDKYYTYNRLDPVGSMIGLVADAYEVFNNYDPHNPQSNGQYAELAQAIGLSYIRNATSKTWAASMADISETIEQAITGTPGQAKRALAKLMGNQLFKVVPYSSAVRNASKSMDPVTREAFSILERIQSNIPGASEDLPPKRDLLGRIITKENAEWYWLNPFGGHPESDNIVDQELSKLDFDIPFIGKDLEGVPLTAKQYSRMMELVGKPADGGPSLEEVLEGVVTGDGWARLSDGQKKGVVTNLLSQFATVAKTILKNEDKGLLADVLDVDRYNIEKENAVVLEGYRETIKKIRDSQ